MLSACLLALTVLTAAPVSANPYLEKARQQLARLDEHGALETLEKAKAWKGNSAQDLALVHLHIGLAHAGLAHKDRAMASFQNALVLDPTLQLPEGQSPRVRKWWQQAGGHIPLFEQEVTPPPDDSTVSPPPVTLPPPVTATEAPPPAWGARRWVGVGLVAAGVVSLGVGLVLGAQAKALEAEAKDEPDLDRARSTHARAVNTARTANWLFGASAAAGVGGVVLIAW